MPIINIKMARGRGVEQKRELVRVFTEEAVRILNVKPEWVTVIIDEYERENWASEGNLHIDKFGPGLGKEYKTRRVMSGVNFAPCPHMSR